MTMIPRSCAAAGLVLAACAHGQALRLLATVEDDAFDVPTTQVVARQVEVSDVGGPVVGVGITALFTTVQGDFVDGVGPWSLDVALTPVSPGGVVGAAFSPIGGDVSIGDYPLQDGERSLGTPVAGAGVWELRFTSIEPRSNWIYGLRGVSYHLFGDAPERSFAYDGTPQAGTSWDRPFFISGISGLGPTAYGVLAFTVGVAGVYEFESVLDTVDDHFTFLYQGSFDAENPLDGLLDYGLGNGNSPFGVPRGVSRISAVLFEGVEYFWVTSQWDRFGSIVPASNTITGPGEVLVGGAACSAADLAEPLGSLDLFDILAFFDLYGDGDPRVDLAPAEAPDGVLDLFDILEFFELYGAGCAGG